MVNVRCRDGKCRSKASRESLQANLACCDSHLSRRISDGTLGDAPRLTEEETAAVREHLAGKAEGEIRGVRGVRVRDVDVMVCFEEQTALRAACERHNAAVLAAEQPPPAEQQ